MSYCLKNLVLPVEAGEDAIPSLLMQKLSLRSDDELVRWRILRKSLDARSKNNLKFVYSVVVDLSDEGIGRMAGGLPRDVEYFDAPHPEIPANGDSPLEERPVIVGSGPAGLLAGYYLARHGYRPLVIERGEPVKERVAAIRRFDQGGEFEPENNYLFGEGGAGCFSDGKLTCRASGPDVDYVLECFVECGGKPSIVYENRPHLGSNRLPMLCRNFRRKIEEWGGEYRFGCCLEKLDIVDGQIQGIATSSGYIPTSAVILAIGHSARDTYHTLYAQGVPILPKAFQLGVRIEQPQQNVNHHKYGKNDYLQLLGAADYNLVARGERDLFTFCMCAGGKIIPSVSEPNMFCSNGMSNSRHDTRFANSGLVVTLRPEEFGSPHPLGGVELQRHFEAKAFELAGRDYLAPLQRAADFANDRRTAPNESIDCSYQRGTRIVPLDEMLPPSVLKAVKRGMKIMDRQWQGRFLEDAIVVGPEMRGSSPVRIDRDKQTRECPGISGLYPVGEGAGYAGGIVTAAVDGLRSARSIVERYAPLEPAIAGR